jgi:hypothetical protein
VHGHVGAGDGDRPPVRLFGEGDGLGCALEGSAPAHTDAVDLGEDEDAIVQRGSVAILLEGEGVEVVASLEARNPAFSPCWIRRKNA